MPSLKDIRKRIASVKNTSKITSAMKMVAAAKLRRAQEAAEASRPFAVKMNELIQNISEGTDPSASPLFRNEEKPKKGLLLVVSSDRGLCGGYNTNLIRFATKFLKSEKLADVSVDILPLGKKSKQAFKPDSYSLYTPELPAVVGHVSYENVKTVAEVVTEAFLNKEYDLVFVAYNEFVSAIQYEQRMVQVLPLKAEEASDEGPKVLSNGQLKEYRFEPRKEILLAKLLPQSIIIQLLTAFYEAEASEHSARMTAMDNATKNASEMIDKLTLEYNRARQASITRELVEIVSGAEALNG